MVQNMSREDHDQIRVMANGDIVLNTEQRGVIFINKSELNEENELVSVEAFKTVIDQPDRQSTVLCIYADNGGTSLTIMSQSKDLKKLRFSKRDPSKNYEKIGADYEEDFAHPILKITIHDDENWIEILDNMGNATSFNMHDKRVDKTVKQCTEIFEHHTIFEQSIVRDEKGKLKLKTAHHGNQGTEDADNSKSQTFPPKHSVSSFFTHCVSARDLTLHVYGNSIYLRHDRREKWLQCLALDSPIQTLYSIEPDENSENSESETRFICVTETTIELLSLEQFKKVMSREKYLQLPGKAIRTKISN